MTQDPLLQQLQAEFENMMVPAQSNPAVALCCRATLLTYREAREKGQCDRVARRRSSRSFRLALPPLIGKKNIRDFIACITHGILLELIPPGDAGRLLYAAQIAQRVGRDKPDGAKDKKNAKKAPKNAISTPSESS